MLVAAGATAGAAAVARSSVSAVATPAAAGVTVQLSAVAPVPGSLTPTGTLQV